MSVPKSFDRIIALLLGPVAMDSAGFISTLRQVSCNAIGSFLCSREDQYRPFSCIELFDERVVFSSIRCLNRRLNDLTNGLRNGSNGHANRIFQVFSRKLL